MIVYIYFIPKKYKVPKEQTDADKEKTETGIQTMRESEALSKIFIWESGFG